MLVAIPKELYEMFGCDDTHLEYELTEILGYIDYKKSVLIDHELQIVGTSNILIDLPDALIEEIRLNLPDGFDISQGVSLFLFAGYLMGATQ